MVETEVSGSKLDFLIFKTSHRIYPYDLLRIHFYKCTFVGVFSFDIPSF